MIKVVFHRDIEPRRVLRCRHEGAFGAWNGKTMKRSSPARSAKSSFGRPEAAQVKRILVPTDFSAHAHDALEHARSLAVKFGARLTILHVFEPIILAYDSVSAQMVECAQRAEDDARELLSDLYAELKEAPGPAVAFRLCDRAPREDKIVGMAKKLEAGPDRHLDTRPYRREASLSRQRGGTRGAPCHLVPCW